MPTFSGSLELSDQAGDTLPVQVTVMGNHLGLGADSGDLGSWSLSEVAFARTVEGFTLTVDGDSFRLMVDDPDGFWSTISATDKVPVEHITPEGPPVSKWWRFWSMESWRSWWARRAPWGEYRKLVRSLDRRIAEVTRSQNANAAALEQARKHLAWARDVGERDVPIRTAKAETGLAAVSGITLLETRRRDGNDVWTVIDSGAVYFTDRKMVFSGRKDVQFPFDKMTVAGPRDGGLHVVVTSRKRDHVLSGPAERLLVVLDACRAAGQGESPTASFEAAIASLAESIEAESVERDEVRVRRAGVTTPPRPFSPAWMPLAALVFVLGALGAGADDPDVPVITAASSTPVPAATTTPLTTAVPTTVTTTSASSPSPAPTSESNVTTTTGDAVASGGGAETTDALVAYFFDVGQGDATLLAGPDFTILIDAGRHDRSDVVAHLQRSGVETIDLLVGTHPHADHIGQFSEVLAAFPVTEVWMSGDSHTTQTFERTLDAIESSDAGYHEPRAGETVSIGSALVEVVNPTSTTGNLHEGVVALRVIFGEVAFLFTGDAEAGTEMAMIQRGHELRADVLQLGHHGSATSTSDVFLEAVGPGIAVYSAAAGNQYGHPDGGVIARLFANAVEVFGTDVHGTVVITTDGSTLAVDTANTGKVAAPAPTTTIPTNTTVATIPTTTEPAEEASACGSELVDINAAGFDDLQRIIHIGPDRADQILRLRPFGSVDSMNRISGIGPARLADIKAQGVACAG